MSMKDLKRDMKMIDGVCDDLANACWKIAQTNDWVANAALVTLEGMLDDLGERYSELRGIQHAMDKLREERDAG
jgi:hypothetical protein